MPDQNFLDDDEAACAVSVADEFALALDSLQRGHPRRAEALCAAIVKRRPAHADALHLLGILALQRGHAAAGVEWLRQSIRTNPRQPMVHCNLGNGLREVQQSAAALAAYRRALELDPRFAGASYGIGNACMDLKNPDDAIVAFDQALALQPGFAEAHNNRGNALMLLGRIDEALLSFRRALGCNANFALAAENAAVALMRLNRPAEALEPWSRVVGLQPHEASGYCGRAQSLMALDRIDEALLDFDAALDRQPDLVEALYGRGTGLRLRKRHQDALVDFDRAQQLLPTSVDILFRKAEALRDVHRPTEAALAFEEVLRLDPERDYALGNLIQTHLLTCDWTSHAKNVARAVAAVADGRRVCLPGPFFAVSDSAALQVACARAFAGGKRAVALPPLWSGERYAHRKIRVAYVSADFREHPVSMLLAGVLEQHDRSRFEIIGVSLAPADGSALGRRVRQAFEECVEVGRMTDVEVAALLREREVDIAVDLMGLTGGGRPGIFAHRPAPVQVSYLGFTGSTGSPHLDYVIADPVVVPPDHVRHYSEAVVHMPECYQPGDAARRIAERTPTRAEFGLPEAGFVFCCFNTHYKITPVIFAIWMRLLDQVPGSVLWLLEASTACMQNLQRQAVIRGVDPARLVFAPRVPTTEEHLARYRCAELFLDTLPFNAHVTANDALWAGLPLLTCQGAGFAGRVASSLLRALDLPELVTNDLEEYENRALRLARSTDGLAALRARLLAHLASKPLFRTERYCRHLETAYATMRERSESGGRPAGFSVRSLPD